MLREIFRSHRRSSSTANVYTKLQVDAATTSSLLQKKLGEITGEIAGILSSKLNSEAEFPPWKLHMHELITKYNKELDAFMDDTKRETMRMCECLSKSDPTEVADRYKIWYDYVVAAVTAIVVFLQKSMAAIIDHRKNTLAGITTSDVEVIRAIKGWESDASSAVHTAYLKADAIFGRRLSVV